MASTVAEIIFLLRARDEASRTFASMTSTSGNAISKMTAMTVGLAKAMSVLTAGTAGFVAKAGFNFNSTLERSTLTIEHFFGKTEKTAKMMDQLTEYAKKSAFGFAEVTDAAAKLAGFQFKQDDILPMLSVIADAAAGAGGDVNLITRALGQIKTSGRVYAQDMNQLANQNVNAWKYLADAAGLSIEELRQKMAAGATIASDQALPVILAGMKKDFGGMQEAYQQSFKGKMERMKDTFSQFAGELTKPLFDKSKVWMDKASAMLDDPAFRNKMKNMVEEVSDIVGQAFSKLGPAMTNAFKAIPPTIDMLKSIFKTVGPIIQSAFSTIAPTIQRVVSAFMGLENGKVAVASLIGAMGAYAAVMLVAAASTIAAMAPMLAIIAAGALIGAAIYLIQAHWEELKTAFLDNSFAQGAISAFSSIGGYLMGSLAPAFTAVLNAAQGVRAVFQGFQSENIITIFIGLAQVVQGLGQALATWPAIFGGLVAVLGVMTSSIGSLLDAILGKINNLFIIGPIIATILSPISTTIKLLGADLQFVGTIIQQLGSLIVNVLQGDFAGALNNLKNMWDGVVTYFQSLKDIFSDLFKNLGNYLGTFIGDMKDAALQIGKAIVDGLREGVSAKWDGFKNWVRNKANDLIDQAKGWFGIHSPSVVFMDIGYNISAGLAQGVASGGTLVSAAMDNIASEVVARGRGIIASVQKLAYNIGKAFDNMTASYNAFLENLRIENVKYMHENPDWAQNIYSDIDAVRDMVNAEGPFSIPVSATLDIHTGAPSGGGGGGGGGGVEKAAEEIKLKFKDALASVFENWGPEVFTHWENGWKALIPLMNSSIETAADQINFDILFKQVFDSMEATFGKEGANVMMAFTKALSDNSPQSAQALTSAVEAMVNQAKDAGVANAAALGAAIMSALATALTEGTPEAIAAVIDLVNQLGTAIANATANVKKSFGDTLSGLLKDLNDKRTYGSEGAGIMKLLGDEVARKSPEFEANVASAVAGMIDKLNNDFGAGGKLMGSSLIAALTTAIKDGTEASLAAVAAILADVNKLFEGGIVTNSGKVFDKDKVKEWSDILGDSSKRVLENIDLFNTSVFDDMVKNHKSLTDDQTKYLNGIIDAYKRGALTLEDAASKVQEIIENANKNNEPDEDKDGDGKPDSYQGGPGNANPDTLDVNAPSFWGTGSGRLGNLVTPSGLMVQVDQGILDGLREIMAFNTLSLLRPLDVMVGFFNRMSTGKDSLFGTSLDVVNNNLRGIHMTMDDIKGIFTKNKFEDLTGGERYWVALAKFGKDFVDHFTKLGISITDMFSLTQEEIDKWRNLTMDQIRADETLYKEWLAFQNKRHVNLGLAEGYLGMGTLPDIGVSLPYTYWNFQRDPTGSPPGVPISNSSLLGRGVNVTSPGITVVQQNNFHAADTEGMDRLVDGVAAKLANEISSMASTTDTFFSTELETPTWNKVKEGSIWQGEKKSGNSTFTAKEKTKLSFY